MTGPYVRATCAQSGAIVWLNMAQVRMMVRTKRETLVYYADHARWAIRETPEQILYCAMSGRRSYVHDQITNGVAHVGA